jgi:hypothetical protein
MTRHPANPRAAAGAGKAGVGRSRCVEGDAQQVRSGLTVLQPLGDDAQGESLNPRKGRLLGFAVRENARKLDDLGQPTAVVFPLDLDLNVIKPSWPPGHECPVMPTPRTNPPNVWMTSGRRARPAGDGAGGQSCPRSRSWLDVPTPPAIGSWGLWSAGKSGSARRTAVRWSPSAGTAGAACQRTG